MKLCLNYVIAYQVCIALSIWYFLVLTHLQLCNILIIHACLSDTECYSRAQIYYVLYISVSLSECMKGRLLTQAITNPWLTLVTYGLSVMMLKPLGLSSIISVTLMLFYMLFYKRSTRWKHLRGIGLVSMHATCWVS